MFDCNQGFAEISRFVDDDVRQLVEEDRFRQKYSVSMAFVEDDSPVQLFGIEFYYLDKELLRQLVRSARDTIGKLSVEQVRSDLENSECQRIRADVTLLLRVILGQIAEFEEKDLLEAIYSLQDGLPNFSDIVQNPSRHSLMIKDLSFVSYEYLHAVLDWRWSGLLLNYEMQVLGMASAEYEELYLDILVGLVGLAMVKYNHLGKDELPTENQFYCPCVRKMWIGMMALAARSGKADFWNCLQKALVVLSTKQEVSSKRHRLSETTSVKVKATDFLFQTWIMNGIAALYQYQILDISLKETPVIRIGVDYSILDSAIKQVLLGETSEEQLRAFLLLLKPIYCRWWPTKHDFLIALWDYFSKRLNSPFQLPSEALSKLACISRSPTGLIEQAQGRASQEAFNTLDSSISSYYCYITLIAFMLRYYSESNQKTKVQILFNRTILKLAPAKLECLTEQGIYNFSLLMLTMMEATPHQDDYLRLSKQLLQFKLDQLSPSAALDSTIRRITTIVLANTALILAFNQRGYDKANHLQQFLERLDEACRKYGDRLQPSMHVLAEGMCVVIDRVISSGGQLEGGEEKFVGPWLGKYLSKCSESERYAVLDVFARLFLYLNSKQLSRVDSSSKILQLLYEIVLPYVKEAFSQPANPCLLIADLAAFFTLFSAGQPYATPLTAMFTSFVDNPSAHPNLRLHYIKLIVKSDRVGEIEDKLLVRSWLKFALLSDREQLRDLSQAVNKMQEFRTLCDIPEYDLCEGDEEPIGLFFKFVGKKYRELEGKDSRAQYNMAIKLHALFQHFDKWVTNPSVAMLRKLMTVLALALKECGPAIYIRSNLTCLYHIAFNHYFLPISVLTDRNVSNDVILAMGKVWHRVMDALGLMNYTTDQVISDHVTNMMVKWAPQFCKFKDKHDAARPFVTFFSSQNELFVTFAFNRYSFAYVELQGALPKANSESGMKMLLFVLEVLHSTQDNGKIALFIRLNASAIMEHAMICKDNCVSKDIALQIVSTMLDCARNNSNLVKMELKNCLSSFTKKHLAMESGSYFRLMFKLADRNPEFIKSMILTIRSELMETERLRGGSEDKHLRRLLLQLEGAVEASFTKQKT